MTFLLFLFKKYFWFSKWLIVVIHSLQLTHSQLLLGGRSYSLCDRLQSSTFQLQKTSCHTQFYDVPLTYQFFFFLFILSTERELKASIWKLIITILQYTTGLQSVVIDNLRSKDQTEKKPQAAQFKWIGESINTEGLSRLSITSCWFLKPELQPFNPLSSENLTLLPFKWSKNALPFHIIKFQLK